MYNSCQVSVVSVKYIICQQTQIIHLHFNVLIYNVRPRGACAFPSRLLLRTFQKTPPLDKKETHNSGIFIKKS